MKKMLKIGQVSEILEISIDTLRRWDKKGILSATRDKNNKYRLYEISKIGLFKEKQKKNNSKFNLQE